MCGEPGEGVGDSFGASVADPSAVAAVMVKSRAKVPAVDGVWGPSAANGRFFVYEDAGTGGCERGSVVVEGAVKLSLGGKEWVDARAAEKIQGK